MKKIFIYTADEKSCKYEDFFVEKSKNWDKLIQPATLGQHTKNRDYPVKIRTVGMSGIISTKGFLQNFVP